MWTRSPRSRRWTAPSRCCRSARGCRASRTHDYVRHGTTTLFAALEIATGKVTDACYDRHRHQEFLRLPQTGRQGLPTGPTARRVRQLRHPQTPRRRQVAHAPPAHHLALHADLGQLAQPRRSLLRDPHPPGHPPRLVPLRRRPQGRDPPLHRRLERALRTPSCGPKTPTASSPRSPPAPRTLKPHQRQPTRTLLNKCGCGGRVGRRLWVGSREMTDRRAGVDGVGRPRRWTEAVEPSLCVTPGPTWVGAAVHVSAQPSRSCRPRPASWQVDRGGAQVEPLLVAWHAAVGDAAVAVDDEPGDAAFTIGRQRVERACQSASAASRRAATSSWSCSVMTTRARPWRWRSSAAAGSRDTAP